MPIVRPYPIGELSTQPLPDVQPGVPAAGDGALFGGNQASDLQRAGPQLGQASDSLFALYERKATEANETRVQDLNNQFITRMQDVLRTGPGAFDKLEGADAINAAGATTETLKKFKAEIFGQTANGYQRMRLGPILDTHFASATEQIARHVDQQQQVYDRNVAAASIKVAEREATTNPGNLAGAVTRAVGAVRVLHKGQPPNVIESESRKAASQVVSSLIKDRLVRNDPSAVGLYRQYQDRLDPKARILLGAAVETLSNMIAANEWVSSRTIGSGDNNIGNVVASKYSYAGGKGTPKGAFETFVTPEHGVAAAYITIKAKADQNGGSISFGDLIGGNADKGGKVNGWAPSSKPGNADTLLKGNDPQAYASILARSVGLKPDDNVPLDDDAKMAAILKAMNLHEKGKQTVSDRAYADGVKLARGGKPAAATGDQTLDAVNAATSMGPVAAAAADARPDGEGVVDYRRQMINVEERRVALTRQNEQQFANDPARMRANQVAIEADYTKSRALVQLAKDRLYASLQDYIVRGGPDGGPAVTMPPATILSQLTDEQQNSVERQINRNMLGKKAQTDNGLWYGLMQGLTSDNANVREMWADTNLMQFKEHLSEEDFKKLANLQADVRTGGGSTLRYVQMINQVVNDALLQARIDPTPRPDGSATGEAAKVAKFHRAFYAELEMIEETKGKATRREAQDIVDGLVRVAVRGGWFSRDVPVFMIGSADVPATDREQIIAAIQKAGGIPTEERVAEVYRHKLVLQSLQTEIPPPAPTARRGESEMQLQVVANRRMSIPGVEPGFPRPSLPPRAVPRVIDDPPDPGPPPARGGISVPTESYDLASHDATVRRMRQRLGLE